MLNIICSGLNLKLSSLTLILGYRRACNQNVEHDIKQRTVCLLTRTEGKLKMAACCVKNNKISQTSVYSTSRITNIPRY